MCTLVTKEGINLILNRIGELSSIMVKMSLATIYGIMKIERLFVVEM